MSFETITIFHQYPLINGYVQVPHNKESDKTRVTAAWAKNQISGSEIVRLIGPSGSNYGSSYSRQQQFLRLPGLSPGDVFSINPVDILDS